MRIIFSVLLIVSGFAMQAQTTIENVAKLMSKHRYAKVYRCFDDNMKDKVPVDQLQGLWEQMEVTAGNLTGVSEVTSTKRDEGSKQTALLQFEQAAVKMILSENGKGNIDGLYITQLGYAAPEYGTNLGTGKKYINFMSHSFNLSGELMIPLECNNCPVVIMVHGSGPNDKDETIGPNKVFYDLALGFASKGIATYRYDKRSKLYPETVSGQFDLYDETINDAISALYKLKSDTSLHFGKYIMLGHSLGAYAMPLIADSLQSEIDGAILFSANARRLEDLIEYQMEYLTSYDGEINKEEAKIIEENTIRAENIRTGNFTKETSSENLLAYWPGTFWRGIANYDPVNFLSQNKETPFYILQGEMDYQITMVDFELWKTGTAKQANVQLKSYEGLTHLFTPTKSKKASPADYFLPNNVDSQVIWDMVDWVNKR